MTRLEVIKLIGDVLTKLDVLRGSLLPDEPKRKELDKLRKKLDSLQLQLVKNQFDANTKTFIEATGELAAINKDLKKTLTDVEELVTTITNLKRFVTAASNIVNMIVSFV